MIDQVRGLSIVLAWVLSTALEPRRVEQREECSIEPEFAFYSVYGDNQESVRASMIEHGPQDSAGKKRFALADWSIKWRWTVTGRGYVDPSSIALTCTGRILLPKLVVTEATPLSLVRDWNEYIERLRLHELKHLRHASARAHLIKEEIAAARRRHGSVDPEQANAIARGVIADIRALDRAYDASTNHGQTEGAWSLRHSIHE